MDIKIEGLSREILEEALQQAKKGRMEILESMLSTLAESRKEPFSLCAENLDDVDQSG